MSLLEVVRRFDTQAKCLRYIERLRWPNGVRCPRCNADTISRIRTRRKFECSRCRYQFTATAGTIFHKTFIPLPKWFTAIYLMCSSKKGISANQIARDLDLPYKTAWSMCHRIRQAMANTDFERLCGIVEMDETYAGGREHGKRGRGSPTKHPVVGMIQERGR